MSRAQLPHPKQPRSTAGTPVVAPARRGFDALPIAACALLLAVGGFVGVGPVDAADGDLLVRETIAVGPSLLSESTPEDAVARLRPRLAALADTVELQAITYESDGLQVKGFLAYPTGAKSLPGVIYNRGGNRDFGALNPLRAALRLGDLARRGYVVVASQYRGVDGGEGVEEFGGAELADVLNLLPLLDALPQADGSRIGMFGWSRGGMMTYLALTKTDRIAAAVVGAAPADLVELIEDRPPMETRVLAELVPNWAERREVEIERRSALRWPEKLHAETPILLLHGSADWRVAPTQSLRMATALLDAKRPFRLILFEGGDHGLSEYRDEVDTHVGEWLDRYVRDGATWPSLEPHGR